MSHVDTVVPAGYGVRFQSHRPRGYYIMDDPTPRKMAGDPKAWGKHLDSVTGVLGVLDKPALPWWGMEVGIDGVLHAVARGEIQITPVVDGYNLEITDSSIAHNPDLLTDAKRVAKVLTKCKLTVNHVRDKAGDRGHLAHTAFETWADTGILPTPAGYALEQQGYISGMLKFFSEHKIEKASTEVIVASREHRYGGRYDLRCLLDAIPTLLDLKTSKRVYASHFLQLEGYEGASLECGYPATDRRVVVHVTPEGEYHILESKDVTKDGEPCVFEDFLAVLRTKRVVARLGGL